MVTNLALTIFALTARLVSTRSADMMISSVDDTAVMGTGSYGRVISVDDGLLGTFSHYEGGTTTLQVVASAKDGRDWNLIGSIAAAPSQTRDLDNPFLFRLKSGRLLAAFRNHDRQTKNGPYDHFRITLCASDNGGGHWEFVTQVAEEPGPARGLWEPYLRYSDDGSVVELYYSRELGPLQQDLILHTSADDGQSWSAPAVVPGRVTDARDGMPAFTQLGNKIYAVYESNPDGKFTIYIMERDVGTGLQAWGKRRKLYNPMCEDGKTRCSAGAPYIITVGDALVVSFQTDEDGPGGEWPQVATSKLIVSTDAGQNWSPATTLQDHPSFWGGLLTVDDKRFIATNSDHHTVYSHMMKLS